MNKKNNKKDLLKEEVDRFNSILEYQFPFYEEDLAEPELKKGQEILLDKMTEEDEENIELDIPEDDIEIPGEEGNEEEPKEDGEESSDSEEEEGFGDEEGGFGDEGSLEEPEMAPEDPMDDAVELDVTQLVQGSEEAKASADSANQKIDQLMGMIDNLENQVNSMSTISNKIDNLENELEKRAPTPEEKIEMRSLDSAPYSLKLTDFWADQKDQYDIMSDKEKEYVLNKKEINKDYSDSDIKDSFNNDNEYEEEDF